MKVEDLHILWMQIRSVSHVEPLLSVWQRVAHDLLNLTRAWFVTVRFCILANLWSYPEVMALAVHHVCVDATHQYSNVNPACEKPPGIRADVDVKGEGKGERREERAGG